MPRPKAKERNAVDDEEPVAPPPPQIVEKKAPKVKVKERPKRNEVTPADIPKFKSSKTVTKGKIPPRVENKGEEKYITLSEEQLR